MSEKAPRFCLLALPHTLPYQRSHPLGTLRSQVLVPALASSTLLLGILQLLVLFLVEQIEDLLVVLGDAAEAVPRVEVEVRRVEVEVPGIPLAHSLPVSRYLGGRQNTHPAVASCVSEWCDEES